MFGETKDSIHAREVSPKIVSSVGRTDFHGVNENGVTLEESADVRLVVGTHEHDVLKQPEEWPVVVLLGPHHGQHAVKLKEQSASPFKQSFSGDLH